MREREKRTPSDLGALGFTDDDFAEVLRGERELARAHREMDLATIDRLLHPGYTILQPNGLMEDKETVVASYSEGSRQWDSAAVNDMAVAVSGNLALVSGLWTAAGHNGAEAFDYAARFLSMWCKEDGRWRNIAYQSIERPSGPASSRKQRNFPDNSFQKGKQNMTPYDPQLLEKYAELIVKVGLNLQPGQRLLISPAPLEEAPLVRLLVKQAYLAGARFVDVLWADQAIDRLRLEYGPAEALHEFSDWYVQANEDYFGSGDAALRVYAVDPDMMMGQDTRALNKMQKTRAIKMALVADLTSRFATNWSMVSGSLPAWATKVFPSLDQAEATAKLWDTIFEICRVKGQDPLANWEKHLRDLAARHEYLTAKSYERLHYRAPGTDLTIALPKDHLWAGGRVRTPQGIPFVPNLPTEEVATTPRRDGVNGVVSSTKPLSWDGVIIEDFSLTFVDGRVVNATAEKGQAALDAILETDEGAHYLGEVALVPHSSPISQSGVLFYNTLFDENASCHLALGRAYKYCIRGATAMSDDAFLAAGGNISLTHVDFMVGSGELDVDGYLADGTAESVLRGGEWAFDV